MGEVAGQFVAPVGRIATDQHRAGQGGRAHPEHVLGDVVEQQGHVERSGLPEGLQHGGPVGLGSHDLVVGPAAIGEEQARPVVAGPLADQLVDGLHRFPLVSPSTVGAFAPVEGKLGTNLEHVAIYQSPVLP